MHLSREFLLCCWEVVGRAGKLAHVSVKLSKSYGTDRVRSSSHFSPTMIHLSELGNL